MPNRGLYDGPVPGEPNDCSLGATVLRVLPRRIVRFRELRGVSQSQLARAAAISRSTLNAIEGGQARDIRVSTLERLCNSLGVSADALLGFNQGELVRRPGMRGLVQDGLEQGAKPGKCPTCALVLGSRSLHLPGDCMLAMSDGGASVTRIGAVFGLSVKTVAVVLTEEQSIRRHRRF